MLGYCQVILSYSLANIAKELFNLHLEGTLFFFKFFIKSFTVFKLFRIKSNY